MRAGPQLSELGCCSALPPPWRADGLKLLPVIGFCLGASSDALNVLQSTIQHKQFGNLATIVWLEVLN